MTEAAQAAKLLRKELKNAFPGVKFSVKSSSYAGGNSIHVNYNITDKNDPSTAKVQEVAAKYEGGSFDGMNDLYTYDYTKTGPTAKYVIVQADSRELQEKVKPEFLKYYGLTAFDDTEIMAKLNKWSEQALYQFVNEHVLN